MSNNIFNTRQEVNQANILQGQTRTYDNNNIVIRTGKIPNEEVALLRASNFLNRTTFLSLTRGVPINDLDITIQTTPGRFDIASQSSEDTFGTGTGAWAIQIDGVDSNWDRQTEIINLDGQNPVSSVNTFQGINEILVVASGSAVFNQGKISVAPLGETFNASGEPTTTLYGCIDIEWNASNLGFHYVPRGFFYIPHNYIVNGGATPQKPSQLEVFINPIGLGLPTQKIAIQEFTEVAGYELKAMPNVPEKSIAFITGRLTSSGNINQVVWFQFVKKKIGSA